MTSDRATIALSKAVKDLRHARAALTGEGLSARALRRHERRERVAFCRVRDAQRSLADLACVWEA